MQLRVHRVPLSTNVERVALAAAFKGIDVDWIDHDPDDRSALRALSGQDLVPVAEFPDGEVLADSPLILARVDELVPFPRLWPADPARRAEADIFVQWFNRVWKVPPNAIDAERARATPDQAAIEAWRSEMHRWVPWFEALLTGRDHLLSEDFGIADVIAFPFLKFASGNYEDDDLFHGILKEELALGNAFPNLTAWIDRIAAMPQA